MRKLQLYLIAIATAIAVLLVAAACGGDGDDGGDGAVDVALPPAGAYFFDVEATIEFTLIEESVSAVAVGQQQTYSGAGTGSVGIDFSTGGSGTFGDLKIDFTVQRGEGGSFKIAVTQSPDQDSTLEVGTGGTSADLNIRIQETDPDPTGGIITGGYLFPVGTAGEPDSLPVESRDVDFFKPLILQFPDDLGRSSLQDSKGNAAGGIDGFTMTLNSTEPGTQPDVGGEDDGGPPPDPGVELDDDVERLFSFFGVGPADFGAAVTGTDGAGDLIYGDPDVPAGFTPPYIDIGNYFAVLVQRSPDVATGFDSFLPCDTSFGDSQVVCAGDGPLPQDSFLFGEIFPGGVIPAAPDRFCTFAVVTDNGTPWIFNPPFAFDFYQDAGHWTQLIFGPDQGWGLFVDEVDPQQVPQQTTSNARAYIFRNPTANLSAVVLDIPANELDGASGWRITADCNEAFDPAQSGGDVPGPDPTGGLLDLPTDGNPIFADGFESGDTSAWSN